MATTPILPQDTSHIVELTLEAFRVAQEAAAAASEGVATTSVAVLKTVREREQELDAVDRDIDDLVTAVINKTSDAQARELLACMKFCISLERIGDLLLSFANRVEATVRQLEEIDVRDLTLSSLRTQVGIVTQETILFNDTVRNNIAYGQPHVPIEQVEAAARAALAHDFILAMPNGYDTVIGEKGFRLSGGERQRLSIARAILKNAPILILDEATSALDTESESLVSEALQNLMQGRTVFVIAHRLSTVRRATRIVVLDDGVIAESGTHEDLLERQCLYRRLYDMQFDENRPRRVVKKRREVVKG